MKKNIKQTEAEIRISFYDLNKVQMEALFNAERELSKAGLSFDTGYDFGEKRRDWEFDWSLKGAKVFCKKHK